MAINVIGNQGEFHLNIVTDGDKCSVVMQDTGGFSIKQGKISIKGDNNPMIKTKIIETTEKYDKDGKLVEKVMREENTEDDTDYTGNKDIEINGKDLCDCMLKEMQEKYRRTGRSPFMF